MITDRVRAVAFSQNERVYNVAEGLAHLLTVKGYPAVYCKVLRQGQVKSHKDSRPDYCVETHDVLSYHVDVRRPEFFIIAVGGIFIAQRRDVVV